MKIAVLGMGRMGQAVAQRLLDGGHELVIWNRTPGRASELVTAGARESETAEGAASSAVVVITSLANDDAVRAVAIGPGGIRSSIGDGSVYMDASTVSPALSGELEAAFARFVAMPILGGPSAVRAGTATYLVGGDPATVQDIEPVLDTLSDNVRRFGAAPLATAAKVTSNLLLLEGIVALAESFGVGRAGGLSDDQLRDLLAESPLVAPALRNRFEGVLTGEQDPWWSTALGAKDVGLALEVAQGGGHALPAARAVRDQYLEAAARRDAGQDVAQVTKLYRD